MGPLPEGDPNRVFGVSVSGGLGTELDTDSLDKPTFTLTVRGTPRNPADAEEWAYALDDAWLDAPSMFQIGDYWVKGKGRFGGPPTETRTDDKQRVERTATYWCRIER